MGITERKEREKERRRNEIINAAEKVFFTKGRVLATMDDVAEEAELSKGTLYLYFKNKEDLYLAINLRGMEILYGLFLEASKKQKTGLEKARAIGSAYFRFYKEYPDYFTALMYFEFHEMNLYTEQSMAAKCDMQGHDALYILIEAIELGIKDGSIRSDVDPVKAATVLWGHSTGLIQLISTKGEHLQDDHGLDMNELIDYGFEMIEYSLQK
ncbi:TetR/AcrR family transcriptional regulator [candidate division KSB1 bacterium]|nr:TetR/AcrR family transcriptional regulator [candidate division KSB1 bacterium]MBL7095929.1 TetR/AcrR family transcriptional regulator [candidate division KSB1 bacterium]